METKTLTDSMLLLLGEMVDKRLGYFAYSGAQSGIGLMMNMNTGKNISRDSNIGKLVTTTNIHGLFDRKFTNRVDREKLEKYLNNIAPKNTPYLAWNASVQMINQEGKEYLNQNRERLETIRASKDKIREEPRYLASKLTANFPDKGIIPGVGSLYLIIGETTKRFNVEILSKEDDALYNPLLNGSKNNFYIDKENVAYVDISPETYHKLKQATKEYYGFVNNAQKQTDDEIAILLEPVKKRHQDRKKQLLSMLIDEFTEITMDNNPETEEIPVLGR